MWFNNFLSKLRMSFIVVPAVLVTMISLIALLSAATDAAASSQPGDLLYPIRQPALDMKDAMTLNRAEPSTIELTPNAGLFVSEDLILVGPAEAGMHQSDAEIGDDTGPNSGMDQSHNLTNEVEKLDVDDDRALDDNANENNATVDSVDEWEMENDNGGDHPNRVNSGPGNVDDDNSDNDDNNSGPGDSGDEREDRDDNSGPSSNRGPGSNDDDDEDDSKDNNGPGGGGDDDDDDSKDHDNSGPGGDEDDDDDDDKDKDKDDK